jgi:hypothetical protein
MIPEKNRRVIPGKQYFPLGGTALLRYIAPSPCPAVIDRRYRRGLREQGQNVPQTERTGLRYLALRRSVRAGAPGGSLRRWLDLSSHVGSRLNHRLQVLQVEDKILDGLVQGRIGTETAGVQFDDGVSALWK